MSGYYSSFGTGAWKLFTKTGRAPVKRTYGRQYDLQGYARPYPTSGMPMITSSARFNFPGRRGGQIKTRWLPENARKKNMRPLFLDPLVTDYDGQWLRGTKRLVDVLDPTADRRRSMPDSVRIQRTEAEELHLLPHTPLLHQQWDQQYKHKPLFPQTRPGLPEPSPPLPSFPRFYNKEHLAELDHWQAATNERRFNANAEFFIYFHFWAHDDDWVHRRRIDVWDYVKTVVREHVSSRLAGLQHQLYGGPRDYTRAGDMSMHLGAVKYSRVDTKVVGTGRFTAWWLDRRREKPAGATLRWSVKRPEEAPRWQQAALDADGSADVIFAAEEFVDADVSVAFEVRCGDETHTWTQQIQRNEAADRRPLEPPEDLRRALPGWSEGQVQALYRQELQVVEEELVNTLVNLDAIMHPTPIMYANQTEIVAFGAGARERVGAEESRKDIDWWFHHQSFALYLPYYDQALVHRLMNWRSTVNTRIGSSPHIDQTNQYSPQPVNCLMQVWRKHNSVWDSRVFRVEHDMEGEFQEEHLQDWSFVEHRKEPQPTPPPHLRSQQPAPMHRPSSTPREILHGTSPFARKKSVTESLWKKLAHQSDPVVAPGTSNNFAQEYFTDTFEARRHANVEVHPEDQPGLEVDVEPELAAVPAAERGKYIRRLGKLYRTYFNPYNALPVRHRPIHEAQKDLTDHWW
eukprot:TRINITY_DN2656_c0_g1_i1.p1 TRINITY_DN2656_c0_g1~~TRINITY_DN2656_c0_g1_i1.p1  ORF type:complete len:718 (+),score=221.24 TRINITY_DN2656_c0_g1_i1:99-2156(+)